MHFELPLTLVQFFIPSLCAGILVGGFFLYGYMALSYRSRLYSRLSILTLFAIGFVGSEMFILGFGGLHHNWQLSIHFHQMEHLSGAFFAFCFPFYVEQILDLGALWKKINRMVWLIGLLFALSCVAVTFINPDLFISSTVHKETWLRYEADYGRGLEGIFYKIRDILNFERVGVAAVVNNIFAICSNVNGSAEKTDYSFAL